MLETKINLALILIALNYLAQCQLKNKDFELPYITGQYIDAPNYPSYLANNWYGKYQLITSAYCNCMIGHQYIDTIVTPNGVNQPGYLYQNVSLSGAGNYNLSFQYSVKSSSNLGMMQLQVRWNGALVTTVMPTVMDVILTLNFTVIGNAGINTILFNHTAYNSGNFLGFFLDNIGLTTINLFSTTPTPLPSNSSLPVSIPNSIVYGPDLNLSPSVYLYAHPNLTYPEKMKAKAIQILSNCVSLPRGISTVTQAIFLLDDLWLYNYDDANYSGIMKQIFNTAYQVESIKWALVDLTLAFDGNSPKLPTSDYTNYTYSRFIEVQDNDSVFINNVIWFIIFTIPQTILLFIVFNFVFKIIRDNYMSKYIRRYCFRACIIQILFEGNVVYFSFLFFNQMRMAFSFYSIDKLAIQSAVLIFGVAFVCSVTFFVMANHLYSKNAGYFIYYFYRTYPSLLYLSYKLVLRPLIQGAAHSLYHYNYPGLLLILILTQVIAIVLGMILQLKKNIFITQTQWIFTNIYHSVFIVLNLALLIAYVVSPQYDASPILQVQKGCVIVIAICSFFIAIADFFPIGNQLQAIKAEQQKIRIIIKQLKNQAMMKIVQQQNSTKQISISREWGVQAKVLKQDLERSRKSNSKMEQYNLITEIIIVAILRSFLLILFILF